LGEGRVAGGVGQGIGDVAFGLLEEVVAHAVLALGAAEVAHHGPDNPTASDLI
jgi:hypothetical protein